MRIVQNQSIVAIHEYLHGGSTVSAADSSIHHNTRATSARGTGGVAGVLAKESSYHQLDSAANLVPTHLHHFPVVQHDMVTWRVLT